MSASLAAIALPGARAWARAGGIQAEGCTGCHNGGTLPTVTLSLSPEQPGPGQVVQVTVTIASGSIRAGGFFLETNEKGSFSLMSGEGTQLFSPTRVGHSSPKAASNGAVTFRVNWTAPSGMGGVVFSAYALGANGDGRSGGDSGGVGETTVAWGCNGGKLYYLDQDEDGHGSKESGQTRDCSKPMYYVEVGDDCDDFDKKRYPGNAEVCDGKDNDCNGMTDEGLPVLELHEDKDGDGYGVPGGATKMGCGAITGWGITSTGGFADCNDADKTIHPDAMETCNYKDDNCNGRVDEGARTVCGTGWCTRYGDSCSSMDCRPGKPEVERCDYLDNDCDGQTDEDVCPAGQTCADSGDCVPVGSPGTGNRGGSTSSAGGAGGSRSGGAAGGATTAGAGGSTTVDGDDTSSSGGCSYARSPSGWLALALLALTGVVRRRRR